MLGDSDESGPFLPSRLTGCVCLHARQAPAPSQVSLLSLLPLSLHPTFAVSTATTE